MLSGEMQMSQKYKRRCKCPQIKIQKANIREISALSKILVRNASKWPSKTENANVSPTTVENLELRKSNIPRGKGGEHFSFQD